MPAEPPSTHVDTPTVQPGWTVPAGPGRHLPGRTGRPPAPSLAGSGPSTTLDGQGSTPSTVASSLDGRVSALDRLTLRLGVVIGVLIALCSYAVSATSLYALGRQAGYAPWQALAVPVVADGPAIYGMVRIVSRSRRGARGAGYGWLLVTAGTAASVAGNAEVDQATRRLVEVLDVVSVSGPYPDRGPSVLVRVYLEIRLDPPPSDPSPDRPARRPRGEERR